MSRRGTREWVGRAGLGALMACGLTGCVGAVEEAEALADDARGSAEQRDDVRARVVAPPLLDAGITSAVDGAVTDASTPDASRPVRPPDFRVVLGPHAVEVRANGTGCPIGTYHAAGYPDGRVRFAFSQFEAEVDPTRAIGIKDCNIELKLLAAEPVSFRVKALRYRGYGYLDDGVGAQLRMDHYFRDAPGDALALVYDFTGPFDGSITAEDGPSAWSSCGVTHDALARLFLRLRNREPRAFGYVNITMEGDFTVALESRPCTR